MCKTNDYINQVTSYIESVLNEKPEIQPLNHVILIQTPTATKDIDISLVVEALSAEFVDRFWEFIKTGEYGSRNKNVSADVELKHEYYRFMKPANDAYLYQIELFSRHIGLLNFPENTRITPIPTDEDLSSLSAILIDNDYYLFTIDHSFSEDDIHIAKVESLICLKCKAFLDLTERKAKGEQIDHKHILKHKKDVFRLATMLAKADTYTLPETLKTDITSFCDAVQTDLPNADFLKSAGLQHITSEHLIEQLKHSFLAQ